MKIPCDNCKIHDICGLVGSRKKAANKVDLILKEVSDGFIEIPVVCTRQEICDAEEDQAITIGAGADAELQGKLPMESGNDGCGETTTGALRGMRNRVVDSEGEGSVGEDHGLSEAFIKAAWEHSKDDRDSAFGQFMQAVRGLGEDVKDE